MAANGPGQQLPAGLYFIATPIGAARDITLRALDILRTADVIAAEDTRSLRHLMDIHGIALADRPLLSYHDHNGERVRPRILAALAEGRSVAYASEAGTPLVADPGYQLGVAAIAAGHAVTAAPGPSAVLAALTVSGLPSDRFLFAGFPPPKSGARRTFLAEVANIHATLIFYESGPRLRASLTDMAAVFGDREAAVARELTKLFETTVRGTLSELAADPRLDAPKGEIVILVGPGVERASTAEDADLALSEALTRLPPGEAASEVAKALGLNRRDLYRRAMALKDGR